MTLSEIAIGWSSDPDREGHLVDVRVDRSREAIFGAIDPPMPPVLTSRLVALGIERLYRHQARAVEAIRSGSHVVLSAGTASGKSLCYQIPIAETALADSKATTMMMFPTKALARDQLRSIRSMGIPEIRADAYDGDTPPQERPRIRSNSNVVLTNPDMVHIGILPGHDRWADFFHRLEMVVIDEMHTLRGVFGSHVAMVIRRLRRICRHYGSNPTFVFASATIGNPGQLAAALCGVDVDVLDQDDSPHGDRWTALWNPPLDESGDGRRRSPLAEATDLFCDLVRNDKHSIAFVRSRKGTELMYQWSRSRLDDHRAGRVEPYRAGYTPEERREVEQRLFSGDLIGVIATNALELGIDVGSLDASVITSFPGTLAAFRQQAGRAGRSQDESLAVLVAGEDALDQWYMNHPDELFSRATEEVVINPENPMIVESHIGCAAYELPLTLDDRSWLGQEVEESAASLVRAGHLKLKDGKLFWARRARPAPQIDIRTSGSGPYTIVADGRILGTIDSRRAQHDAHEGAVYLHRGESFVVDALDGAKGEVRVHRDTVDYYTQSRWDQNLEVLDIESKIGEGGGATQMLGWVRVESWVTGYQKRRLRSREFLDTIALDLPPSEFTTQAVWWSIPDSLIADAGIERHQIPGSLHAAEHAAIGLMPLLAVCDRWDIGGLSTPWHQATGTPTIFIYEGIPGGAGIAPIAFAKADIHLAATLEALKDCPCHRGCPSCVQSPKCGNGNEPLSKVGAILLLETMLS